MVWSDFKSKLTQILDIVAPLKSFKLRPVELAPWDDDELSGNVKLVIIPFSNIKTQKI